MESRCGSPAQTGDNIVESLPSTAFENVGPTKVATTAIFIVFLTNLWSSIGRKHRASYIRRNYRCRSRCSILIYAMVLCVQCIQTIQGQSSEYFTPTSLVELKFQINYCLDEGEQHAGSGTGHSRTGRTGDCPVLADTQQCDCIKTGHMYQWDVSKITVMNDCTHPFPFFSFKLIRF
jgi:hypothetical protein